MPRFIDIDSTLSSGAATDARAAIGAVGKGDLMLNVKDYGATGDGTTNDSTAIQAALDSATDVHLHFPPGTYRIGAPLLKTGGRLRIDGVGATIKPTNSYTLPGGGAQAGVVGHEDPVETFIEGLVVDGNSTAINGGSAYSDWTNYVYGISVFTQDQAIGDAARVIIRNCHVKNYPSVGINIAGTSNVNIQNNVIENGMFHGINLSRTTGATTAHGYISGNKIVGRGNLGTNASIGGIGILLTKFNKVTISDNTISDMSDTGTKTDGCSDIIYRHNIVTDSGKDGIKVMEHPTTPGSAIYSVSNVIIDGNIISRINAWRTDGSALILTANLSKCVISNNLMIGGGTRIADAIRIINGVGANYSETADMVITGNVTVGELVNGMNVSSGDTTPARAVSRLSVVGNRFSGRLTLGGGGVTTGDWAVKDNVISLPAGAALSVSTAISVTGFSSGSVAIEGNQISSHTLGVTVFLAASATVDTIRIARNVLRNTNGIIFRVDCFTSGASAQLVDISDNSASDPTSGGATVTAPWRVGLANITLRTLRLQRNVIRSNSSSGTFSTAGELIGTPGTPINYVDMRDNVYDGAFTSTGLGGVTLGTTVTRIIGLPLSAVPAAGTWLRGDRIDNSVPAEAGSSPNKYVITGWRCVTAGTPGTWVQERSLTGG